MRCRNDIRHARNKNGLKDVQYKRGREKMVLNTHWASLPDTEEEEDELKYWHQPINYNYDAEFRSGF